MISPQEIIKQVLDFNYEILRILLNSHKLSLSKQKQSKDHAHVHAQKFSKNHN